MTEEKIPLIIIKEIKNVAKAAFKYLSPKDRKEVWDDIHLSEHINTSNTIIRGSESVPITAIVTKRKLYNQKEFITAYKEEGKKRWPTTRMKDVEDRLKIIYMIYKEYPNYSVDQLFATGSTAATATIAATATTEVAPITTLAIINRTPEELVVSKKTAGRPPKHRFTVNQRTAIWNHWIGDAREHKCLCCYGANPTGRLINKDAFECGHIKAESSGGSHAVTNIVPICTTCNKSCGAKNMVEYVKITFGKNLVDRLRGIYPDWTPEE